MKIIFDIPDESIAGIRQHVRSHGSFKPNPITGINEFVPEFESVSAYLEHVIVAQIEMFNDRHPTAGDARAEKAMELKRVEAEMRELNRPKVKSTVEESDGKGK